MGILLTTGQVASELTQLLANADGAPTITSAKVLTLIKAKLFKNKGQGTQYRIDRDDVVALATRTRYVADPAEIDDLVFRVSVIEEHDNVCYDLNGEILRVNAGVDYTHPTNLEGVEGVWKISLHNANRLVAEGGILLATSKGYVHPDHVRKVVRWEPVKDTSRRYFRTEEAPKSVQEVIGTGIWIDVPPGRESDILVG